MATKQQTQNKDGFKRRSSNVTPVEQIRRLPDHLKSGYVYKPTPSVNVDDAFNVDIPLSANWGKAKHRLMFVLQTVPGRDMAIARIQNSKTVQLAGDGSPVRTSIYGVVGQSLTTLSAITKLRGKTPVDAASNLAVGVINWNAAKTFHLDARRAAVYDPTFTQRVTDLIEKHNPTHVVLCGHNVASSVLGLSSAPLTDYVQERLGWVIKKDGRLYTPSLDLDPMLSVKKDDGGDGDSGEGAGALADLLFAVSNHVAHLLYGQHPFSLKAIKTTPVYINTIDKFDKLMTVLERYDTMALDIETRNLTSYNNAVHTVQFAVNTEKGFVIPVDHPKGPFTDDERLYVKKKLRAFIGRRSEEGRKTFVGANIKFDTRVLRAALKLNVIHHHVIDVTAGEALLDENIALLPDAIRDHGQALMIPGDKQNKRWTPENLRAIYTSYENDFYYKATFGKEQRNLTALISPDDPAFLMYAATDVVAVLAIAQMQVDRAKVQRVYSWQEQRFVPYDRLFTLHRLYHMGRQSHGLSTMEQHGSAIDLDYMISLTEPSSPLIAELKEVYKQLRSLKSVNAVNDELIRGVGIATRGGLFSRATAGVTKVASKSAGWLFSFNKPAHKKALFIEHLELEPLSFSEKTGEPTIDKAFLAKYAETYPEAKLGQTIQEIQKLLSTYVVGWIKLLRADPDSISDKHFRAGYRFFHDVTGRLASFKPNHQNIPSRGRLAKLIKRMFRAAKGEIQVRADYSAHEVRMGGIAARDPKILKSFNAGLKLRQQLLVTIGEDEIKALEDKLKMEGDIHIQNVFTVFKKWVPKSHILRDTIKNIAFGLFYGLGLLSLAAGLRTNKIKAAVNELADLEKQVKDGSDKDLTADIERIQEELLRLRASEDKDFSNEAQDVTDRFFAVFSGIKSYLDTVSKHASDHCVVSSWTGRQRRLFRAMSGHQAFVASAQRRGKNAPIQGSASEIGISGTMLSMEQYDLFKARQRYMLKTFPKFTRVVHDASYFGVRYADVIPFIWCYQYCATFGIADEWSKRYGFPIPVPPEIEIEMSATEDEGYKWDWTMRGLRECIEKTADALVAIGNITQDERSDVIDQILAPARDSDMMRELQQVFPILNVPAIPDELFDQLTRTVPLPYRDGKKK